MRHCELRQQSLTATVSNGIPQTIRVTEDVFFSDTEKAVHAFHSDCLRLVSLEEAIEIARKFTFDSHRLRLGESRRLRWARSCLVDALLKALHSWGGKDCPLDILLHMSSYLVREYLTVVTVALFRLPKRDNSAVNLSEFQPVIAKKLLLGGLSYLTSLSNSPRDGMAQNKLDSEQHLVVYIAEDYLSITQIRIGPPTVLPNVDVVDGQWWKTFPVPVTGQIIGKTNVRLAYRGICPMLTACRAVSYRPYPATLRTQHS